MSDTLATILLCILFSIPFICAGFYMRSQRRKFFNGIADFERENNIQLFQVVFNKNINPNASPGEIIATLKGSKFYSYVFYMSLGFILLLIMLTLDGKSMFIMMAIIIALMVCVARYLKTEFILYDNAIACKTLLKTEVLMFNQLDSIELRISYTEIPTSYEEGMSYPRYYTIIKNGRCVRTFGDSFSHFDDFESYFDAQSEYIKKIIN